MGRSRYLSPLVFLFLASQAAAQSFPFSVPSRISLPQQVPIPYRTAPSQPAPVPQRLSPPQPGSGQPAGAPESVRRPSSAEPEEPIKVRWRERSPRCATLAEKQEERRRRQFEKNPPPEVQDPEESKPAGVQIKGSLSDSGADAPRRPSALAVLRRNEIIPMLCGFGIDGIDPGYTQEGERPLGSVDSLVRALHAEQLGETMTTLVVLAASYQCYSAKPWRLDSDSLRFLACSTLVPPLPSSEQVAAAVAKVLPQSRWEADNLQIIWQKTSQDITRVQAAFAGLNTKYAEWRSVWIDAAAEAQKKWQQAHDQYAAEFRVLDPITEKLRSDPRVNPRFGHPINHALLRWLPELPGIDAKPPDDCVATLLAMRERLASTVHPKDASSVRALRFGHPIAYQLTEALALCYLRSGQSAHARVEIEALHHDDEERDAPDTAAGLGQEEMLCKRRAAQLCAHPVSLAEAARCGRAEALDQLRKKHGTVAAVRALFPETLIERLWDRLYSGLTPPELIEHTDGDRFHPILDGPHRRMSPFHHAVRFSTERTVYVPDWGYLLRSLRRGGGREIGFDPDLPAVVSAMKKKGNEIELSFKPNKKTSKYRDLGNCHETDRVHSVSFDFYGRAVFRYRQECKEVGPVKTAVSVKQEDPVLLPAEEAASIEVGMQVKLLSWQRDKEEGSDARDAAVFEVFVPGKKPRALVVAGIKLEK